MTSRGADGLAPFSRCRRSPSAPTPVIRVAGLVKRYGDLVAVDGIDFEVARGEVFGLLGPNGAGKTTTVEILEGLRTPDGGRRRPCSDSTSRRTPSALKPRIGVSLQTAALYPKLTVIELIDLFRSFYATSRPTAELIDALELGERKNARTSELSGGQRQRLAVALALVNDPELVFLDEPTTGLDPAARRALWDLVLDLKRKGRTVLLTTHYMEEAEVLCDRLAIMDHGRILEMGTVEELVSKRFQERAVQFDSIENVADSDLCGDAGGDQRQARRRRDAPVHASTSRRRSGRSWPLTESRGVEPQNLGVRRATLEDVFLDLTGRALRD